MAEGMQYQVDPGPSVAVVSTVRNATGEALQLIDDLEAQVTSFAFSVVLVDGGSTDGTYERISARAAGSALEIRVESWPGNISQGRNRAIELARTDVIVTVDAGTRLPRNWLEDIAWPISVGNSNFVAGFFKPDVHAAGWHAAISAMAIPVEAEFRAGTVLPSARCTAFLREDWVTLEGYPEHLDHTEDLVFYRGLRQLRGAPTWVYTAPVTWDARPNLQAFFRQYRLYARGDAIAGIYLGRHALRYGFYASLIAAMARGGKLGAPYVSIALILLMARPLRRMSRHEVTRTWSFPKRLASALAVQLSGDLGKMIGYLQGQRHRARSRARK